jgi:hypothetical protein
MKTFRLSGLFSALLAVFKPHFPKAGKGKPGAGQGAERRGQ